MLRSVAIILACMTTLIDMRSARAQTDDASTDITHLRCDGIGFELQTMVADGSSIGQRLVVTSATGRSRTVGLPVLSVHQVDLAGPKRALNRSVTQWACRHTGKATFLELLYKCNDYISDRNVAHFCARSGEWLSYIDLQGHILDAGYRPDDPRYPALERGLGVPTAADEEPRTEPLDPVKGP